tara:strand:+ start:289 stop:993 length:705 start_codon:yes stop_codon:yes gene_type:complete
VAKTVAYDDIVESLQGKAWMYFLLAVIVFASVFYIAPDVIEWLAEELLPEDATLIYLSPAEYLILKMRVAGYAAISFTFLLVIINTWHVIRKRSLLPDIDFSTLILVFLISILLFATGMLYSLKLMLPTVLEYLQNDAAEVGLETTYSLSAFYHFVFLLTFSLGITFQLPLIVMLILKLELATTEQLAEYRSQLVVVFFILAALITPPDVISQFLLAVPLIILYELSIIVGKFT